MTAVFAPNGFYKLSEKEFVEISRDPAYRIAEDRSYAIHLTWLLREFKYGACYKDSENSQRWEKVTDWCAEHAGANEFLLNRAGNTVLFKNEYLATMFKLTWSE